MFILKWIFISSTFKFVLASRAGINHCSGTQYPASISTSGTSTSSSGSHYMMQDPAYQLGCCGVVSGINFASSPGDITLHIWRQNDDQNFELVSYSRSAYSLTGSPFAVTDFDRVSFREGDLFGWTGGAVHKIADASTYINWYSSMVTASTTGDTYNWYNEAIDSGQKYALQVTTAASTAPYFRNLPTTLQFSDTELVVGGVTLMTLSYNDVDPDDAADLTVSLSPIWDDMFDLTLDIVTTKTRLEPGSYEPVFLIEEGHCGVSATATLTVTVIDSMPSINNLPAFASVHEDDLDETLLHTVILSDPTDQPIWCQGDWTIGAVDAGNTKYPFIVKMLSTAAGSSEAGIYLIEDPQLDYDIAAAYELTVKCQDTYGNEVTGKFYVNVIENQKPLFYNLGNMVEVDASRQGTGFTAFTVSTTDADNDQITFTYTCAPAATCPVVLYDSGEVVVTSNLLAWTVSKHTLTITAEDLRDTSAVSRDLVVYISNINNVPAFTNVNGNSVTIEENEALGKSLYQMSATDADAADNLVYNMVIDDLQGYGVVELSTSGELTTHSVHSINYETLTTYSFTLTVYVNDGEDQYSETFTVTVTDVNEPPEVWASEYIVWQDEGPAGAFTDNPGISASDVDAADTTLTYTKDCGTYDAYITLDPTTAALSFAQEYDLDNATLALPIFIECDIYAHDSGGLNDSAKLYINLNYINDENPVFNPNAYTLELNSDTPLGWSVLTVTATDGDLGDDSDLVYTIDQSSLGGVYFVIDPNGVIYADEVLWPIKSVGTQTLTVTATDSGGLTDTATISLTIIDVTYNASTTTDRDWQFIDDPTNITWLSTSVIAMVTCAGIIIFWIVIYCMRRKQPLIDLNKLFPKPTPKRKLDNKRRKMPYSRKELASNNQVHASEVLRNTPLLVASPAPVDPDHVRPGSGTSGRVTVTEVRIKQDDTGWMDGYDQPEVAVGPAKAVTYPRTTDWEYMNPVRQATGSVSPLSEDLMYGTPLSEPRSLSKQRRTPAQRQSAAGIHVPVSPSPVTYDNVDFDDFRSERISIATPLSVASRGHSPARASTTHTPTYP